MKLYVPALFLLAGSLISGCKPLGYEDQKQADANEQQIQAYITANKLSPTKSNSGLYYQIKNTVAGARAPQLGERVTFTRVLTQLNGKVLGDSSKNVYSAVFGYTSGPMALHEGLSYLKEGEGAVLLAPFTIAYGAQDLPIDSLTTIPGFSPLRFDIKLLKTRNQTEQIQEYIGTNKLTVTEETTSGLRYIRTKDGVGSVITDGKAVELAYTLKLITGEVVQKSSKFNFTVGSSSLIPGFVEGVKKMKAGEKATIIFPSSLGYGNDNYNNIPGHSPLVYELEILSAN